MTAEVFPGGGLFERGAAAFAASIPVDPADDGFFGPGSVTWRLHADLSAPVRSEERRVGKECLE